MSEPAVRVKGLRELQAAFKQVDADLPRELKARMKTIADHVVGVAQQRMPFQSGEAARSIKPRATTRGAGIAFPGGGTPWAGVKADYFPWLDFGGTTGRGHKTARPVVKGGRFVYPAIAESTDEIALQIDHAIEETAERARFETRDR